MRFQLETGGQANLIRSYAPGCIVINQESYTHSLIVLPQQLVADWGPRHFEVLEGTLRAASPDLDFQGIHENPRSSFAVSSGALTIASCPVFNSMNGQPGFPR